MKLLNALVTLSALAVAVAPLQADDFTPQQLEFFENKIRPVLAEQCYSCHSTTSKKLKGSLFVDSREGLLKGGDTGPAIVPGKPDDSLLIKSIRYDHQDLQMPPKGKLPDAQIADFVEWVKQGAAWPQEAKKQGAIEKFDLAKRKAEFWMWQAPRKTALPKVKNKAWGAQPIDQYILARLEEKNLLPAPPADDLVLLRRLHFDLIGLPPKADEVQAFAKEVVQGRNAAIEKVVDRLLASPQFGERWGRHWLDSVRYAETRGHEFDYLIPNAYQYRDYVVRALNADVPYDQFVTEHIAGDLMPKPRLGKNKANESILGTGFWFLGEEVHSPVSIRGDETDRIDNRLDVMTKTFQGLTVSCARCHDHKFDAISQKDYYALSGFLISSGYRQARFATLEHHREIAPQIEKWQEKAQAPLLKATGEALKAGLPAVPDYLMAAREVLVFGKSNFALAEERNLNIRQLNRWTEALQAAKEQSAHPLHAFAVTSLDKGSEDATEFSRRLKALLENWQQQKREVQKPFVEPEMVVADYTQSSDWMQDGFSFGSRPLQIGEGVPGNALKPLRGIVTRPGARRGEAWKKLAVKDVERDVGTLGAWERSEQTLRTRDFTLKTPSLWYLVRGALRAYAVVNSHLVIIGPLHGATIREFEDKKDEWRWVQHPLNDYVGHRLHVELSPVGDDDLSVAMVVQSDKRPPLPQAADAALENALADAQSPGQMVSALANVWQSVARQMTAGKVSPQIAQVADGLVRDLDLFVMPGSAEQKLWREAALPTIQEGTQLAAQIGVHSPTAPAMMDGDGVDEFLLIRGQAGSPSERVPRRFLEALAPAKPVNYQGSGRLQLAQHITDSSNPLTARVMVNRVWHHLLGRGIVPSVDNFGVLGQEPSHRELLDYLALRFQNEQDWSVKKLIREIVLSKTYQMSSAPTDKKAEEADPENILLHRANVKRLQGEAIRDSVLAISGRLDPKIGGPPVPVHLTPFMDGRGRPPSGPLDGEGRRSIYLSVRRNFLQPMLLTFDMPIPFTSMGKRNVSNVPAQSLILMNDPFIIGQTKLWAKNVVSISEPKERVRQMYLAAFGRAPHAEELEAALSFVNDQSKLLGTDAKDEVVWADLGHVLINVKEFIYLR